MDLSINSYYFFIMITIIITATNNLLALVMSLLCLLKRRHLATVVWRTCTLNGRGLWLVRLAAYRLPLPINATVFFQSFRAENWHRFTVKEEIWRICFASLTKDSLPPELQAYFFYFLENYNLLWEKLWLGQPRLTILRPRRWMIRGNFCILRQN